ncbi:hypothetical protein LCGC14_0466940 [marine sediment metagenome]|uniref:Uncharacterized protein n=1 Tax=marine sediment metagenome TaxID=412755 RepID=A0A0F9SIN6_9ZZZZ
MSREDIPNVLIRLTNVTGFDHTQEANLAFKEATDEIERLLADEQEKVRESQRKLADKWQKDAEEADWPTKENICRCCLIICAEQLRRQLDLTAPSSTEEG